MVKFAYQLEAQLIPEWKDEFFNYRLLKKIVKRIKVSRPKSPSSHQQSAGFGFSLLDPIRSLADRFSSSDCRNFNYQSIQEDKENLYKTELVQSREDEEKEFFEKLEDEMNKVNTFYSTKVNEFCERGEILNKQLQILVDLKQILLDYHHRHESVVDTDTPSSKGSLVADEVIATLERNGVCIMGSMRSKTKKGGRLKATAMRIDIPATTATRTISAVTSTVWEDLVTTRKDGASEDYITRKKIQCAEKMIRGAFLDLYRGLEMLNTYSSLNMEAFRKILKKYDKVTNQHASGRYLKVVERAFFIYSFKVDRLADEVESLFTKHFANNERKKAMMFLRPQQPQVSDMITFFQGLFTGIALFCVYAIILAHLLGIFSSTAEAGSLETV